MKTLVHVNPLHEFRTMEDVFEKLFARPQVSAPNAVSLPIDIFEQDGKFSIKASVAGVAPENLDIQVENNVLTIRGETKHGYETNEVKVYRRELSFGAFARSIRLPEDLNLEEIDAQFTNGFVTITIPRLPEEKPKAFRVNVRTVSEPVVEPSVDSTESVTTEA